MSCAPPRGRRASPGSPSRDRRSGAACLALALALAACGGGGGNPLGNPPDVANPNETGGQKLSFAYYQKCINPILLAQLQIDQDGVISTNSCAGSGCHDDTNGTGGALRVVPSAAPVDLADPANTPAQVQASDMYKNFYSSQAAAVVGSPDDSRLLTKPLVQGVLHGGGLIFEDAQDPNARLIRYWISRPAPQGQDEFSSAANSMFTPPDPATGSCNTE